METTRLKHRKPTKAQGVCDAIERRRGEPRLQAAYAALEQRTAQVQALAAELTQAEQRERRRLAQLLHDHLQQLLVAARLRLGILRCRNRDESVAQAAAQVDEILDQCLDESRSLTVELSPPVLYEAGLAAALEWLGSRMRQRYGLTTVVEADRQAEPADESLRVLLFQAVQELLFNVVKHARVDRARVTMTRTANDETRIEVSDSGVGFDASQAASRTASKGGFGLFSIRRRLGVLAGHVEITGEPGKGTRAVICVPLGQPGQREGDAVGRRSNPRKRADGDPEGTQGNCSAEPAGKDGEGAHVASACDAPPFPCPGCGRPVPDAAEAVRKHERFLKRLFDRQDGLQQSLASAIHDGLAQQLVGALLYFEGSQQLEDGPRDGPQNNFRTGLKLLRDGIQETRRIAGRLRPLICGDSGLECGIEYLIHEIRKRDGPEIVLEVEGEMDRLPPELENAVFWIFRELLTNACRHSGTGEVRVRVTRTKDHLELEVEDWGTGFDPAKVDGRTFGLQEAQQRARLLGGEVIVNSVPGQGTRVVVTLPVDNVPFVAAMD
jgi:signal transduction histidine kinase